VQEEHRRALVDHPEVRRILPVQDGDHPDPGMLPPLEICHGLLHVVRRLDVEQCSLGSRSTASGLLHAAMLFQLLGHRGPDDLRPS